MLEELPAYIVQGPRISSLWTLCTITMDAAIFSYMSVTKCAAGLHHVMSLNTLTFISTAVRTWNLAQEVTALQKCTYFTKRGPTSYDE
jgi:hypothetical protein